MRRGAVGPVLVLLAVLVTAMPGAASGATSAAYGSASGSLDAAAVALAVQAPATAYTTDDVVVTATLTLEGGEPVADATVRILRSGAGVTPKEWSVPTDATGTATVTDALDVPAEVSYDAVFDGTAELASGSAVPAVVQVDRRPTSLVAQGPAQAAVDESFVLSGTLSGPSLPAQVTVSGPEGFGTTVATDAAGGYQLEVSSHLGGDNTFTVAFPATTQYAAAAATVTVNSPLKASGFVLDPIAATAIGEPATISGTLTGTDRPVQVQAARTANGTAVSTVMTDANGAFSLQFWPDLPSAPGPVPVHLRFAGNARNAPSATQSAIAYVARPIAVAVRAPSGVEIGLPFTVSGDLGSLLGATTARITPSNGPARVVPVGEDGHFTATVPASYSTGTVAVTVRAGGTGTPYAAASRTVYVAVKIRPELRLRAAAPRAVRRGIAYYRVGDDPLFVTGTATSLPGICHRYRVQRVLRGTWTTVRTSACVRLDRTYAESRWRWRTGMQRGVTYRVFAAVAPTARTFGGTSTARLVRFR